MTNEIYVLNQVQISVSNNNRNWYSQTYLFRYRREADKHLTKLCKDTLSELYRLRCDFDVYSDSACCVGQRFGDDYYYFEETNYSLNL